MAIPKKTVIAVLDRDGWTCMLRLAGCLGHASVADHRADRGMGGSKLLNSPVALVAACGLCNGAKTTVHGDVLAELIDKGLRIPKAATNAETLRVCQMTPVRYPDGMFWLLPNGKLKRADERTPF